MTDAEHLAEFRRENGLRAARGDADPGQYSGLTADDPVVNCAGCERLLLGAGRRGDRRAGAVPPEVERYCRRGVRMAPLCEACVRQAEAAA